MAQYLVASQPPVRLHGAKLPWLTDKWSGSISADGESVADSSLSKAVAAPTEIGVAVHPNNLQCLGIARRVGAGGDNRLRLCALADVLRAARGLVSRRPSSVAAGGHPYMMLNGAPPPPPPPDLSSGCNPCLRTATLPPPVAGLLRCARRLEAKHSQRF